MDVPAPFLSRDARNRAWRTFIHSVLAAAIVGALDAVWQILQNALLSGISGQVVDWRQVGVLAGSAALTAFVTPLLAYAHRKYLDPSSLPSAAPPKPPATPSGTSPARRHRRTDPPSNPATRGEPPS